MKKFSSYIATLAVGAALVSGAASCDDNFTRPPMVVPTTDLVPNVTIEDFKTRYWQDERNYVVTPGYYNRETGEHIVIRGRVVSSNESGNIYNNIVIQDETAAITIAVKTKDMTTVPLFGQNICVDVTGLQVGGYNSLMQLGAEGTYNGAPSMTFMEGAVLDEHFGADGLPSAAAVDTALVTMEELATYKTSKEGLIKWQSRIVRIDGVSFADAGQPYNGGSSTVSRTVRDEQGNTMILRISNYADFARDIIPSGTGSVTGILSYFGTDWQILPIDKAGMAGFDETPAPVGPVDPVSSIDENFDASTDIPAGWTQAQLAGNKTWYVRNFNENNYITMTGYKGTAPFDQWLLTPPVDMSKVADKVLTFDTQVNGYGSKTSVFEVYVLDNADPAKATVKAKLTPAIAEAPASGYSDWVASGSLDLSTYTGTVYIGFRYAATEDANYATWCVDNVILK